MTEDDGRSQEQENYEEPGVYAQPGGQDNAQPLDHRDLDDGVSAGKKASEDLLEDEPDDEDS